MCNFIMKTGELCPKSKSKERCWIHPISKFPVAVSDIDKAEKMMDIIFKARLHHNVSCPCGKSMKRWNYAHHCTYPKHKAWVLTMPTSENGHLWSIKPLDVNANILVNDERTNGFTSKQ